MVLVCGGRTYADAAKVDEVLSEYNIVGLCHGDAAGADRLAAVWAEQHGVYAEPFPADWSGECREWCSPGHRRELPSGDHRGGGTYCPAAGVYRNNQMLDEFKPELVIAFPGHKGTQDMVKRAAARNVKIRTVWQ